MKTDRRPKGSPAWKAFLVCLLTGGIILLAGSTHAGSTANSMVDLIEGSNLALFGTVLQVEGGQPGLPHAYSAAIGYCDVYGPVRVAVRQVVAGAFEGGEAALSELRVKAGDGMLHLPVEVGDEILVFGTLNADNSVRVSKEGEGVIYWKPFEAGEEGIEAAEWLMRAMGSTERNAADTAMLEGAKHPNARVRRETRNYFERCLRTRSLNEDFLETHQAGLDEIMRDTGPDSAVRGRKADKPLLPRDAVSRLAKQAREEDAAAACVACAALAATGQPNAVKALIKLSKHANAGVRLCAALYLRGDRNSGEMAALLRLLDDPDAKVRAGALYSCYFSSGEPDVRLKTEALADDPDENVRFVAVRALGRVMDGQAVRALVRVLKKNGETGRVKIAALQALGGLETFPEEAVESMADPGLCGDDYAVAGACMVLKKSDSPRALAALAALTKRPGGTARMLAAMALRGKTAPEARDSLVPLLDDPDTRVRCAAMSSLASVPANLGQDALLPEFMGMLQDPDEEIRRMAAFALGTSEDPAAVKALLEALAGRGITRDFQMALLNALGGAAQSIPPRKDARWLVGQHVNLFAGILKQGGLEEPYGPAGQAAAILQSLAEHGDETALEALKQAAQNSPDSEVGRQIRQFLDNRARLREEPWQRDPKGEP